MGIKERLKRLERKMPDRFQDTVDYLKLSWKVGAANETPWPDPPPEIMRQLEIRAKELVNQGETLSIGRLLRKIDGKGQPTIKDG